MSTGNGRAPGDGLVGIGEFARRSRLSMKALRLYDRLGLLPPTDVDPHTGYRRYQVSLLETARLIALLRRLDMPLAQVAEVVSAPPERRSGLLAAYWDGVEHKVAGQRELVAHLQGRLSRRPTALARFDVRVREVPEQVVLTEQRHVLIAELETWTQAALDRLTRAARPLGGQTGAQFRIFHGEVNEDSDGPVEVCVPVLADVDGVRGVALRREPAHQEAYVRLTLAQYEFPQVLSAYEAVEQWIGQHGALCAGPPREIDLVASDGPTISVPHPDEVCDVAFPIC